MYSGFIPLLFSYPFFSVKMLGLRKIPSISFFITLSADEFIFVWPKAQPHIYHMQTSE